MWIDSLQKKKCKWPFNFHVWKDQVSKKIQKFDSILFMRLWATHTFLTLLVGTKIYTSFGGCAVFTILKTLPWSFPLPTFLIFAAKLLERIVYTAVPISLSLLRPHWFGFCPHNFSETSLVKVTHRYFSSSSYWNSQHFD